MSMVVPIVVIAVVALLVLVVVARRRHSTTATVPTFIDPIEHGANDRVTLRFVTVDDREFLLELAADPNAAHANGWAGSEAAAVEKRFGDPDIFAALTYIELIAIDAATHQPVGTTSVTRSPVGGDRARSVGVQVHPRFHNQGYGRAIMAAAITNLQQRPEPIMVGTATTNVAMQRVMSHLGYEPEPATQPYMTPNGNRVDSLWYNCSGASARE